MVSSSVEAIRLLLQATFALSLSAALVAGLIKWFKPASATLQRIIWLLVLLQGTIVVHLPVQVAWYERETLAPALIVDNDGATEDTATSNSRSVAVTSHMHGLSDVAGEAPPLPLDSAASPREAIVPEASATALAEAQTSPHIEPARRVGSTILRDWDWPSIVLSVWLAGAVVLPVLWLLGYIRLLRHVSASVRAPTLWDEEWSGLLARHNVRQSIQLRVTRGVGPLLVRTPLGYRLLIPRQSWSELDSEQRLAILRHELAHCQRGDAWKSIVFRLLALPHWFNPVAWWVVRKLDECAEWACDSAAGSSEANVNIYVRALLKLGSDQSHSKPLATAARGGRLYTRIKRLLFHANGKDKTMKKWLLLGIALALVVLNVIRPELVAQEPNQPSDTEPSIAPPPAEETNGDESTRYAEKRARTKAQNHHTRVFLLRSSLADDVARVLKELFGLVGEQSGSRGKSQITIASDAISNTVVVSAPADHMKTVDAAIAALDAPPRQAEKADPKAAQPSGRPRSKEILGDSTRLLDADGLRVMSLGRGVDVISLANSYSEALSAIRLAEAEVTYAERLVPRYRSGSQEQEETIESLNQKKIQLINLKQRSQLLRQLIELAIEGADNELTFLKKQLAAATVRYENGGGGMMDLQVIGRHVAQVQTQAKMLRAILKSGETKIDQVHHDEND